MSELSERIIDTAPKAHGCTVTWISDVSVADEVVHQ